MDPQLSELMKRRRKKDSTTATGSSGRSLKKSLSSTIGSGGDGGGGGGTDGHTVASGSHNTVTSGSTQESSESREKRREERRAQRNRERASSTAVVSTDVASVAPSGSSSGSSRRRPEGERDRTTKTRRKKSTVTAPPSREASGAGASSTTASASASRSRRKSLANDETNNQDNNNNNHSSDEEGEQKNNEEEQESSDEEPAFPPTSSDDTPDFAAAFGETNLDFTAATTTTTTTNTATGSAFDPSAFSSFDSFPVETMDTTNKDAGSGAFDYVPPPVFALPPPPPPQKIYDKTPLVNPPVYNNPVNRSFLTEKPRKVASSAPGLPPPVINPLNGHWIVCQTNPTNGEKYLCQVDPHTGAQVLSVPLLSTELQRKVATKYGVSANAVDTILQVSVGIHKSKHEGGTATRSRVACLMDLLVLDNTEVLRVVGIWQWGYAAAGHPIALQSVLSPPSGSDFIYNPLSLLVADSCVFVSGASAKGPCVFLCKPTVRETWSANFVGKETARISCMSVTKSNALAGGGTNNPYLAIALTDGSLSVWTYEPAMQVSSKTTEVVRRLVYPLCRLEGNKILTKCSTTGWDDNKSESSSKGEVGYCTHLEWISPKPALSTLPMLAAAFQGGVSVYHVALPVLFQSGKLHPLRPPTPTTQLSQTPQLKPWGIARWPNVHHLAQVSWLDMGPHALPTLAVLLTGLEANLDYARLVLCSCPLAHYDSSSSNSTPSRKMSILASPSEWKSASQSTPKGLVCGSYSSGFVYHAAKGIYAWSVNNRFFGKEICSQPLGLTSAGTLYFGDTTDNRGVYHVYTNWHVERKQTSSEDASLWEWSPPTRRHWLCKTLAGDCKDAMDGSNPQETKDENSTNNHDEVVTGGASSNVLCELGAKDGNGPSLASLLPDRIVRSEKGEYAAVLFRETQDTECTTISFLEQDPENSKNNRMVQVVEGREAFFLATPTGDDASPQALVLDKQGGSISLWSRKSSKDKPWQQGTAFRPILGVEADNDTHVECRRMLPCRFQNKMSLLAFGTKMSDGKSCLVMGPLEEYSGAEGDAMWATLLPNIEESPVFWLDKDEDVTLLVSLPSERDIRGGISIATNKRVLILSCEMKLLAETPVSIPPSSLVPMGSFTVAFCNSDYKIRYLTGLQRPYGTGLIATLPMPRFGYCPHLLIAVRPDRLLIYHWHCGTRLVEKGQSSSTFLLPMATTRPALLLEPMVANAISTGGKDTGSMPFLRTIVEKFGRKAATMTHGEDEGIGNHGAGLTPKVFELLSHYGLKHAASWLLTGTVHFDRAANSRLLPSWMPVSAKVIASIDADSNLHVIANGDQYFSEYVKSPDTNMTSTLPRPSDPSAYLCNEFARDALAKGNALDALKMLDVVGTESTDAMVLQIALALQVDPFKDVTKILQALCQSDGQVGKAGASTASASLAALALEFKTKKVQAGQPTSGDFTRRYMKHLAPSFQRGKRAGRLRQRIIGESAFAKFRGEVPRVVRDRLFSTETSEAKHVWNEGPNREKENLLMLDDIREWFGRRRPVILGKEGAKSAEDRGASTLADILNQGDDDSFGGENDDDFKDGWVEGVGEGMKDEDKLSSYFRFSEGDDEDDAWREEGFTDLTKFETKATLFGDSDTVTLEPSTSSVDEGESGKVKALFDLVFGQSGYNLAAGLALPAPRGGGLDVGMLHGPDHDSRQKCTIEFWFMVPEKIKGELVLVRRTFGSSADDLEKVGLASDKSSVLWELVLLPSGEIEMRTVAGAKSQSKPTPPEEDSDEGAKSSVQWSRWTHVCLTLKQETVTTSSVNVFIKGSNAFSDVMSFSPPNFEVDDFAGASGLDGILEKSHLLFGLNHPAGFRTTELRVWALERMDDDIRTLMAEYLDCAEMKRKFRVKIKKKGGAGKGLAAPAGGLAPPGGLAKPSGLAPPGGVRAVLSPPGGLKPPADVPKSGRKNLLLGPPKDAKDDKKTLAPPPGSVPDSTFGFGTDTTPDTSFGGDMFGSFGQTDDQPKKDTAPVSFDTGFGETAPSSFDAAAASEESPPTEDRAPELDDEMPDISPLWDSAIPLSEQVRSSAAAALIRGPPATRHFGGNRGGLPDYRELERLGVGAVSICGSEKTIVWRDDQVPPGLTYPIGASGAIVSDQMDEDGSEFLCCFLAKDKRMVVFELSTRTVVVELQMTTKLNYWRFLPPEAGEDTLCFMLVTPVGGFHWMPLDESPRPRQVWKRGPELQGKKIVSYEEGGTNGLDGPDMLSKVGMLLVTNVATGGRLESWLVPICGDSQAICASDDVLGACLCRPPDVGYEAWMPLLLFVVEHDNDLVVCISAVTEESETSVGLTEVMTDALIETGPYENMDFQPPTLAMGTWPEVLCCSLGSTIVVIVRRKGLVIAYELAETGLELIAQENVGHYVVDAVMRYSAVEGGAEIVLLMSDSENPRDGRVGTFCFRSAV